MRKNAIAKIGLYLGALATAGLFVIPLLWLVLASVQRDVDLLSVPPKILPEKVSFDAYGKLLFGEKWLKSRKNVEQETGVRQYAIPNEARLFPRALTNSLLVSVSTTLLCLFAGSLTAYTLSRFRFRGRRVFALGVLGTRMIPPVALLIPFFLLAFQLRALDQKSFLVVVYTSFILPYVVWILKGFFDSVPVDLEDAARIDGCSRLETLWRIMFPLAMPGLVATGIFSFMQAWNEFFFALILTNSERAFTVPVIAGMFATEVDINYSLMLAAGVLTLALPLLFTFLFQRLIVYGLTSGGVKS